VPKIQKYPMVFKEYDMKVNIYLKIMETSKLFCISKAEWAKNGTFD